MSRFFYGKSDGRSIVRYSTRELGNIAKNLSRLSDGYEKAQQYTISDLRTKVPGIVSKAVSRFYAIPESYVVAKRARKDAEGEYHRGRNKGKGNVRLSTEGKTIASLTFIFRGRKEVAPWPVYVNGKKLSEKAKNKVLQKRVKKKVNGKTIQVQVPYTVAQETYRGKPTPLRGKNGNRVFVVKGRLGKYMPVIARPKERKYLPHATSSVPQAVMNPEVAAIWKPLINALALERFNYHCARLKLE